MKEITFVRYVGICYPKGHSKAGHPLPDAAFQYYSVPGGGVATGLQCTVWGQHNRVQIFFQ